MLAFWGARIAPLELVDYVNAASRDSPCWALMESYEKQLPFLALFHQHNINKQSKTPIQLALELRSVGLLKQYIRLNHAVDHYVALRALKLDFQEGFATIMEELEFNGAYDYLSMRVSQYSSMIQYLCETKNTDMIKIMCRFKKAKEAASHLTAKWATLSLYTSLVEAKVIPITPEALTSAIEGANKDIVVYLCDKEGLQLSTNDLELAVKNYFPIGIKLGLKQGLCPPPNALTPVANHVLTCNESAEIMQLLLEQGAKWGDARISLYTRGEVISDPLSSPGLIFAATHGCPWSSSLTSIYHTGKVEGVLRALKLGCPRGDFRLSYVGVGGVGVHNEENFAAQRESALQLLKLGLSVKDNACIQAFHAQDRKFLESFVEGGGKLSQHLQLGYSDHLNENCSELVNYCLNHGSTFQLEAFEHMMMREGEGKGANASWSLLDRMYAENSGRVKLRDYLMRYFAWPKAKYASEAEVFLFLLDDESEKLQKKIQERMKRSHSPSQFLMVREEYWSFLLQQAQKWDSEQCVQYLTDILRNGEREGAEQMKHDVIIV